MQRLFSLLVIVMIACIALGVVPARAVTLLGGNLELNWDWVSNDWIVFNMTAPVSAGGYTAVSIAGSGGAMDGRGVACNQTATSTTDSANCTTITTSASYTVSPRDDPGLMITGAWSTGTHSQVSVRVNATLLGLNATNLWNVKTLFAVGTWDSVLSLPLQHGPSAATNRSWMLFNYTNASMPTASSTSTTSTTTTSSSTTTSDVNATSTSTTMDLNTTSTTMDLNASSTTTTSSTTSSTSTTTTLPKTSTTTAVPTNSTSTTTSTTTTSTSTTTTTTLSPYITSVLPACPAVGSVAVVGPQKCLSLINSTFNVSGAPEHAKNDTGYYLMVTSDSAGGVRVNLVPPPPVNVRVWCGWAPAPAWAEGAERNGSEIKTAFTIYDDTLNPVLGVDGNRARPTETFVYAANALQTYFVPAPNNASKWNWNLAAAGGAAARTPPYLQVWCQVVDSPLMRCAATAVIGPGPSFAALMTWGDCVYEPTTTTTTTTTSTTTTTTTTTVTYTPVPPTPAPWTTYPPITTTKLTFKLDVPVDGTSDADKFKVQNATSKEAREEFRWKLAALLGVPGYDVQVEQGDTPGTLTVLVTAVNSTAIAERAKLLDVEQLKSLGASSVVDYKEPPRRNTNMPIVMTLLFCAAGVSVIILVLILFKVYLCGGLKKGDQDAEGVPEGEEAMQTLVVPVPQT